MGVAEFGERQGRCPLLGFLLIAAPGGRVGSLADAGQHLKGLVVVRALLVDHAVGGRDAKIPLRDLLEQALVVEAPRAGGDVHDLLIHEPLD